MQLSATFAQWQSVVAAVDPRSHQTMVYNLQSIAPNVIAAGIVEADLACSFDGMPTETELLAVFPNAIKVVSVSSP